MSGSWLQLKHAYHFGYRLHDELCKTMLDGKPISTPEDMGLLAQIVYNSKGDHLEIGSAYGASMMVAIRAIELRQKPGVVVCIEPFGEDRRDTLHKAVEKEFWRNVEHFGVKDKIEHIKAFSNPLPVKKDRRFGTAFIDGDHAYEYVLNDWLNLKDIVDEYIMLHDYSRETVRRVVEEHIVPDPKWFVVAIHGWSAVIRKKR